LVSYGKRKSSAGHTGTLTRKREEEVAVVVEGGGGRRRRIR
jgi:hypothetical protein